MNLDTLFKNMLTPTGTYFKDIKMYRKNEIDFI